jgi:hypothetical protein
MGDVMSLWKQKEEVMLEHVDDKSLIFDSNSFKFYEFNETMSFIWSLLEKPISEDDLVKNLIKDFNIAELTATKDVKEIIEVLKKKQLIVLLE